MALDEGGESRAVRAKKIPPEVSQEEYGKHQTTHLPFRSWCEHCVRGKAADDGHRAVSDAGGDPKWGMDYFFLSRAEDPEGRAELFGHAQRRRVRGHGVQRWG